LIDILYQNLSKSNFKVLTKNDKKLSSIFGSTLKIQELENLIDKIKNKTDSKFISEALKMRNKDNENLFFTLIRSGCTSIHKFKWLLKIMEKYLESSEIIELMIEGNIQDYNILQVCVHHENTRQLAILFGIFKNYFGSLNLSQKFKDLVKQKHPINHENILYFSTYWKTKETKQTLWRLLLNTFDDREELKDIIMQNNENETNPAMFDFVIRKITENFNNNQCAQILRSKGQFDRSLLQVVEDKSNDINQFESVWKNFQKYLDPLEIFDLIIDVDENGDNILLNAMKFKSSDICEFIFDEIKGILDLNKEDNPKLQ